MNAAGGSRPGSRAARLSRARPESLGISPSTIHRFLDACESEIHSLYGFEVASGTSVAVSGYCRPMEAGQLRAMYSIGKSLTSLAVGIAAGEGRLGLDDPVVGHFPAGSPPERDPRVDRLRVRHLLTMAASSASSGAAFAGVAGDWRSHYLSLPLPDEPGRSFSYDTGASYMLSCLVTKCMGANVLAVLRERVFDPMGIGRVEWMEDGDGNNVGGWGVYLAAGDMPKIGRLLLSLGEWNGRRLIPEWYMREALSKRIDTRRNPGVGWPYGYGYQFWMLPEECFGCYGALGQLIVCSPGKNLCVATVAGCPEKEARRLGLIVTETIIAEAAGHPVPDDEDGRRSLMDRLGGLSLPAAAGSPSSPGEAAALGRDFRFRPNSAGISGMRFDRIDSRTLEIAMTVNGREARVRAGHGKWRTAEAPLDPVPLHSVHGFSYGWGDDGSLELKQYMCNTPYFKRYRVVFIDGTACFEVERNVLHRDDKADTVRGEALNLVEK